MSTASPPRSGENPPGPSVPHKKASKKTRHHRVPHAIIHLQSTYNNTLISVTDPVGNVIAWSSAGRIGYSGARKATPYVAQEVVRDLVKRLEPFQVREVEVEVKGIGSTRESALRIIASSGGLAVTSIRDVTPAPHNGCRPPKRRRV